MIDLFHGVVAPSGIGGCHRATCHRYNSRMVMEFVEEAIWWRGPAPFVFAPVPPDLSAEIKAISARVSYGWGVIPVKVQIGATQYATSLFPKNGVYLLPIKAAVQKSENLKVGDKVRVTMQVVSENE